MTPTLGIVLVHFGPTEPTRRALAAIAGDPSLTARKVVVVDNSNSFSGHSPIPGLAVLAAPDNPGFGSGANRGAAALIAGEPLSGYLFLNGDVEIVPGFLDAAAAALAGGAGAVGGPLYLDEARTQVWYAGGRVVAWRGTVLQERTTDAAARRRPVGFIPGAALVVGANAFATVGGFDERFFLYNEDVDLCLRLSRAGFSLLFEPEMAAIHHVGGATGSAERSPLYLEHLTRTRLLPFPSRLHRLWLAVLHTGWLGVRSVALLTLRGGRARAQVAALLRGHRAALASAWSGRLSRRPSR
ncbi:MAG TPA: glycosyltransferase family 2 protein [Thermoanaerobaculia bacterium]|nr:glycosyltransferase family 2 protein [Thermoanaerobaculia bacterium]